MKKNNLPMSVSLVIPTFNNETTAVSLIKNCEELLKKIAIDFEILISDDKSIDMTPHLLKECFGKNKKIKIFTNKKNVGIAKNVFGLYKKAQKEYILLFSVDGDWSPIDIKKLIYAIYNYKSDIVIGKRNRYVYSIYRRIISFFYNTLPLILFGTNTIDAGSIKVFRSALIRKIPLKSKSVFFEAELIIRAKKLGYKISSTPISFRRTNKKSVGGAKIKLILQSLKDLIILFFTL